MKSTLKFILCGTATILMAACSTTNNQAPRTAPSATVKLTGMSAAYYGAAATGKGTLNYQSQTHHFTMTGVGVGGTGAQKVSATGKVYKMYHLADFAGTYHGTSQGLTLGNGKMQSKMTNEHGVVVYLTGKREGLATNGGLRSFTVKLSD
ncbi:MAG: hypothetical protein ABI600_07010 [Luteolibacter sp.]